MAGFKRRDVACPSSHDLIRNVYAVIAILPSGHPTLISSEIRNFRHCRSRPVLPNAAEALAWRIRDTTVKPP